MFGEFHTHGTYKTRQNQRVSDICLRKWMVEKRTSKAKMDYKGVKKDRIDLVFKRQDTL